MMGTGRTDRQHSALGTRRFSLAAQLTLNLNGEGLVLALLEELGETRSTVEEEAGRGIEIGSELSEGGDITVLGKVKLERSGDSLHDLLRGSGKKRGQLAIQTHTLVEDKPWSGRRIRHGRRKVRR